MVAIVIIRHRHQKCSYTTADGSSGQVGRQHQK